MKNLCLITLYFAACVGIAALIMNNKAIIEINFFKSEYYASKEDDEHAGDK